ncbi:MAG: hypothetical protein E6I82_05655 [Chloroflexi bacterium]|nr:MAG: hypothetical protein E6I82_05655 [Chloroflexota bacterium]
MEQITARSARRTIPFVGRASEQAILGQSLGLASTTGRPVLVTIMGEAGIGKSRLADELAAGVSAAVLILRGQSRSQTDTATFSPAGRPDGRRRRGRAHRAASSPALRARREPGRDRVRPRGAGRVHLRGRGSGPRPCGARHV